MAGASRQTGSSSRPSIAGGWAARTAVAVVAVGGGTTPPPAGCQGRAGTTADGMTGPRGRAHDLTSPTRKRVDPLFWSFFFSAQIRSPGARPPETQMAAPHL